jgi:hypothetical protein
MKEDQIWRALLSASKPAFAGETEVPYGFVTRTMARLRDARREREQLERISLRAIFASLAMLALVATVTAGMEFSRGRDVDPGMRSLLHVDYSELF